MNKLKYILGIIFIFFIFIQTCIGYDLSAKLKKQIDVLVDKKVNEKNAPKILKKIENIDKTKFSESKKEAYNYISKKVEEKLEKQKTISGSILQNSNSGSNIIQNNDLKTENTNKNTTQINYNDIKYQTKVDNSYGKGLNFIDSTKIKEDGKVLFNGHWYFLQSDEYYEGMNKNKTSIKVAGSFGNDKKVYNTEEKGFVFVQNDGFSSSKSGNIQKRIDLIRYNENFYFQDLFLIKGWSLEEAPVKLEDVFSGVYSYKEFLTISNYILKQNNLYKDDLTIKEYLNLIANIYNNIKVNQFLSTLDLK
ncbi:MAG: hypothetical protein PHI37_05290 [Candidatus Gracilibacteria bacterium]|nr:hypothetical protein [Candidatus Gracilibacteria bacterium]